MAWKRKGEENVGWESRNIICLIFFCLQKRGRTEKFTRVLNIIWHWHLWVLKCNYCLLPKPNLLYAACAKEKSINIKGKSLTSLSCSYKWKKNLYFPTYWCGIGLNKGNSLLPMRFAVQQWKNMISHIIVRVFHLCTLTNVINVADSKTSPTKPVIDGQVARETMIFVWNNVSGTRGFTNVPFRVV